MKNDDYAESQMQLACLICSFFCPAKAGKEPNLPAGRQGKAPRQ